jgi:hypothetical protein
VQKADALYASGDVFAIRGVPAMLRQAVLQMMHGTFAG